MRLLATLVVILCLTCGKAFSQTYTLNNALNGQTVSTCSGTFTDSNPSGSYGNNENYTVTFCPATAGSKIRFEFDQIRIALGDTLTFYDGSSTNAAIIYQFIFGSTVATVTNVIANNPAGCVTVQFKSDATNADAGWHGVVKCAPPCQPITGTITTIPAADADGNVTMCAPGPITLKAIITYPNNGANYTQSNALNLFHWKTGFTEDIIGNDLTNITKYVTSAGGYHVKLVITDTNGCKNDLPLTVNVRTSAKPKFNVPQPASICLGDTATITSNYTRGTGSYQAPPLSGNYLFLPDGAGNIFRDTIKISSFAAGQTLTSIASFLGVYMNMEHSYLGDLRIRLIAPNGTAVTLKENPGGGGCFLGEPVDQESLPNVAGVGYEYGFVPAGAQYGTMLAESNLHNHTFVDNAGFTYNNALYLPAGTYTPFQALSALIGTPLNGNWILEIQDNLAIDNGYIFYWKLAFAPFLYPNPDAYAIGIKTAAWQPASSIVSNTGSTIRVSPPNSGSFGYTFRIVDSGNCTYDTVVSINVNSLPNKPNLGPDKIFCGGFNTTIAVSNPQGTASYLWNTGQTGTSISVSQPGTYIVTATNFSGCNNRDTIYVGPQTGLSVNLGADRMYCASSPNILQPTIAGALTTFLWSDNSTGTSLQIPGPGTYWFEGTSAIGCKVRDSIVVTDNPINNWNMPNDTTFCGNNHLVTLANYPTGTTFNWFDASTADNHPFTASGNYGVTATYSGCARQDNMILTLNPVPSVAFATDSSLYCASASNVLAPAINGTIDTYQWNNGGSADTLSITGAGLYWLNVTTNKGCTARDTIIITDNPINNWQAPNDSTICGSNLTVTLGNYPAGTTFTWSNGSTSPTYSFTTSGTYTVTANYIGCLKQDNIILGVNPIPTVAFTTDSSLYCASAANVLAPAINGNITTYQWNNGGNASTLPITSPGVYWLDITTDKGCKARDTITVLDNPINNWQTPNDSTICGSNLTVALANYPAGTTFNWFDGATNPVRSFTNSGNYAVTANYLGCLKPDNIVLGINPIPTVTFATDTMLYCASAANLLAPSINGNINTYQWSNGGSTNSSLPITGPGLYWLNITTDKGCVARDTIVAVNNPINGWQMPNDVSICGGSHLVTLANYPTGTSFNWFDGSNTPSHLFTTTGNYIVTANYLGCLKLDDINLAINAIPTVDMGNSFMYCASVPATLSPAINGTINTYQWSNNGSTTSSLLLPGPGTYWLKVTTQAGCNAADTITVPDNPINSWVAPVDGSICDGTAYTATLSSYPAGANFTWYDGKNDVIRSFDSAGTYGISANYVGCLKQDTVNVVIRPLPMINIGPDTSVCYGFTVPLHVSYPGASYQWNTGATTSDIRAGGLPMYWVEATLNGCKYRDSINVDILDCSCNPSIPNAFSPNGDGINDKLKVHIECFPYRYQFSVFNRYGQEVFNTYNFNDNWDGTYKGKKLAVGTYYYIVTFRNEALQRDEVMKGYVVLLQ